MTKNNRYVIYTILIMIGVIYSGCITDQSSSNKNKIVSEREAWFETKNSVVLGVGVTWDIGNGWTITAQSIDAKSNPRLVWLIISRNGTRLDDIVAPEGYTYNYNNIFSTKVASIYPGPTSDMVSLTNLDYQ